jgi:hypothetical protein
MSLDPQVQASFISSSISLLAGAMGGNWFGKRHQNARCEKICMLMVNGFDKLLTALEVSGEPPEIRMAIRDARDSIITAKNYLGIGGVADISGTEAK